MKRCHKCNEQKSPEEFHRNRRMPDGLCSRCKACAQAYARIEAVKRKTKITTAKWLAGRGRFATARRQAEKKWARRVSMMAEWNKKKGLPVEPPTAGPPVEAWSIDEKHYAALTIFGCYFCRRSLARTGLGLTRIVMRWPYTPSNVVPTCSMCARARAGRLCRLGFKEMQRLGQTLGEIMADRDNRRLRAVIEKKKTKMEESDNVPERPAPIMRIVASNPEPSAPLSAPAPSPPQPPVGAAVTATAPPTPPLLISTEPTTLASSASGEEREEWWRRLKEQVF